MALEHLERSFAAEVLAYTEEPAESAGLVVLVAAATFHGHKCYSVLVELSPLARERALRPSLHYLMSSELIWMMGRILVRHSAVDDPFESLAAAEEHPLHRSDTAADSFALVEAVAAVEACLVAFEVLAGH